MQVGGRLRKESLPAEGIQVIENVLHKVEKRRIGFGNESLLVNADVLLDEAIPRAIANGITLVIQDSIQIQKRHFGQYLLIAGKIVKDCIQPTENRSVLDVHLSTVGHNPSKCVE